MEPASSPARRDLSVDAYRGLVMLLIATEALGFDLLARLHPSSCWWSFLAFHWDHVAWTGCSLHDVIQPSFSFLVGVALPFSIAARAARGDSPGRQFRHALRRSCLLVALGVGLRCTAFSLTNVTFEDTLAQIGLGYPFLFLLGFARPRTAWVALGAVLGAYWLAWALYPLPGPQAELRALGVPDGWAHGFTGIARHWDLNTNAGAAFDRWFLNLFPRRWPFTGNPGGYLTLSFIPTLGTMILGLAAGRWLRAEAPGVPFRRLGLAALGCLAGGLALHTSGLCPIVKRIWTPSWTLFSGGLCFLLLMAFGWTIRVRGWQAWARPLVVVGVNSIAAYLLIELLMRPLAELLEGGLHRALPAAPGATALLAGACAVGTVWLLLLGMRVRGLYLKL